MLQKRLINTLIFQHPKAKDKIEKLTELAKLVANWDSLDGNRRKILNLMQLDWGKELNKLNQSQIIAIEPYENLKKHWDIEPEEDTYGDWVKRYNANRKWVNL